MTSLTVYSKYLVMWTFFLWSAAVLGQEQARIWCLVSIALPFAAIVKSDNSFSTISDRFSTVFTHFIGSMVFWHISQDIKERVLWFRDNGYITDDICDMFGVSLWSIQHWQSNLDWYSSVIPPKNPLQGLPWTLDADQWHDLFSMLDESPKLFLDEIQDWVALSHDIQHSKSALHYLICDAGITYKLQ